MKKTFAIALTLLALSLPHHAQAQDECQFLSTEKVNEILAAYAPWDVTQGGAGSCSFQAQQRAKQGKSVSIQTVMLTVTQTFHTSAKEAANMVKTFRTETAKASISAIPIRQPGAGSEAFVSVITDQGASMLSAYGHSGKAVVNVVLNTPGTRLSASDEMEVFLEMVAHAVQASNQAGVAEQASRCPALESPLVKQLISGKSIKLQQFSSDTCMASNDANAVVMYRRYRARDAESLAQIRDHDENKSACRVEKLAQFTPPWLLSHSCSAGNPHAEVSFTKGLTIYTFSVIPGKEPSAKQKTDLIELAKKTFNAVP